MSSNRTNEATSAKETDQTVMLARCDARRAAVVCEKAFRDGALTRYLFPAAPPSDRGVIAMFEFLIRYANIYGLAHAPTCAIEEEA